MDRNSLTLLAVLTLSVSNLFVGISSQNKLLVLASAAVSAALAALYIVRELIQTRTDAEDNSGEATSSLRRSAPPARFPLWVFVVILFIVLPALMWFLQLTSQ